VGSSSGRRVRYLTTQKQRYVAEMVVRLCFWNKSVRGFTQRYIFSRNYHSALCNVSVDIRLQRQLKDFF
jgi:hypothetical protein